MALTYYDTLGAEVGASPAALKRAYLLRSQLLHPDRHAGSTPEVLEAAGRAMAELNRAWEILRDPASRRLYDASINVEPYAAPVAIAPQSAKRSAWWRDPAPAASQFTAFA